MRTIGVDLGISARHKAVVADEQAKIISPVISLGAAPSEMEELCRRARQGAADDRCG